MPPRLVLLLLLQLLLLLLQAQKLRRVVPLLLLLQPMYPTLLEAMTTSIPLPFRNKAGKNKDARAAAAGDLDCRASNNAACILPVVIVGLYVVCECEVVE